MIFIFEGGIFRNFWGFSTDLVSEHMTFSLLEKDHFFLGGFNW